VQTCALPICPRPGAGVVPAHLSVGAAGAPLGLPGDEAARAEQGDGRFAATEGPGPRGTCVAPHAHHPHPAPSRQGRIMTGLTPYLTFPGTAREALTFYQEIFGDELVLLSRAASRS